VRVATAWARWQALAKRAAEFQSNVLLFILYFVLFVPIALIQRIGAPKFGSRAGWQPHADQPTLEAARRQF
jgi:hypothetical protein